MRRKMYALTVFVALAFVCLLPTAIIIADVPTVLEIKRVKEGAETFLEIQVRHGGPTSSHYTDAIEVEIDGKVEEVVGLEPQTSTKFTVRHPLEKAGASRIRARAHCIPHGWSGWTSEEEEEKAGGGGIPGFPYESIALGLMIVLTLLWWARRVTPN